MTDKHTPYALEVSTNGNEFELVYPAAVTKYSSFSEDQITRRLFDEEDIDQLTKQRDDLLKAAEKAKDDINWMMNNQKLLNPFVFDYLGSAIAAVKDKP